MPNEARQPAKRDFEKVPIHTKCSALRDEGEGFIFSCLSADVERFFCSY